MDNEPDYTKYTLSELLDVSYYLDRERYPERAQRLDDEIALRRRKEAVANQLLAAEARDKAKDLPPYIKENAEEMSLEFHGSAREYFRIWIVNLCLTLLTLGFFSAWAKVRKKRYSYSHTTLEGTPFQYLAQPIPILKGRLVAAIGFLVYYTSSHFFTSLLPCVLAAGLVIAPWVIIRSFAFNLRYSAYRNMTFHFDAGYFDALKVLYLWGIIPIFVLGVLFGVDRMAILIGVVSIVFAIMFPWWIKGLKSFTVEHTFYGGTKGAFFATGGQYFKIYFISGLIMMALAVPLNILLIAVFGTANQIHVMGYLSTIVIYIAYVVAFAYVRARTGNLVWNNVRLGPIRFHSTLHCSDLIILYMTNALGIVCSLGLLIPWAVVRTWKYRADNMKVWNEGDLNEFKGSQRSAVTALGAETVDFFDVDLSL